MLLVLLLVLLALLVFVIIGGIVGNVWYNIIAGDVLVLSDKAALVVIVEFLVLFLLFGLLLFADCIRQMLPSFFFLECSYFSE